MEKGIKMMKILKNQKGITLVALVVTIIVLIILAGISINLLLGNEGILKKARDGRNNYQVAANEETVNLAELEAEMESKINGGSGSGGGSDTISAGETATNGNKTYSNGTQTATIPKGFTVSLIPTEKTISEEKNRISSCIITRFPEMQR